MTVTNIYISSQSQSTACSGVTREQSGHKSMEETFIISMKDLGGNNFVTFCCTNFQGFNFLAKICQEERRGAILIWFHYPDTTNPSYANECG